MRYCVAYTAMHNSQPNAVKRSKETVVTTSVLMGVLALAGCSPREAYDIRSRVYASANETGRNWTEKCPSSYDLARDYFPEKTEFLYSTQLKLQYHNNYKVVDFLPTLHLRDPLRYVLYQCGTPKPTGYPGAQFIEVPVQRAVLNEPAFGESVAELGVLDHLYAVNDAEAYTNPALNEAIESGRVRALGTRYGSTIELAAAADPDAVFLFYSSAPNANVHPALVAMGVHGIPMGNHFERDELGTSEWLKFLALLFNREARANELLAPRVERYKHLKELASRAIFKPKVMMGFPQNNDTWTAVGAQNAYAQTVRDAGGAYFLKNDETSLNKRMQFEAALDAADDARIWIGFYGVNRAANLKTLLKPIPQLAALGPVRHGNVFATDAHMQANRAFPFNDQSLDHPDEVLADFIWAIHPDLLPDYQPTFIRQLR